MCPRPIPRLLAVAVLLLAVVPAVADAPARRVVTLAPHLAELVVDAGAGDRLVGVIAFSDHPPSVRELPQVGDAFGLDRERIVALRPDLILAWAGFTPPARVARLEADGHRVVTLAAERPEDVAGALLRIAELTGTTATARPRAAAYLAALAEMRARYAGTRPVRVFVQLSTRPLYTVSDRQMIGRVLDVCGATNVFGRHGGLTPVVGPETVVAASPELILSTGGESDDDPFAAWRRFPDLPAVAAGQLYGLTPDWVTRPSLRLVDGAREICGYVERARRAAAGP